MPRSKITKTEERLIDALVEHYQSKRDVLETLMDQLRALLTGNTGLYKQVHSIKWRVKDPLHLRDKLIRRMTRAKERGSRFDVTRENLFTKINDLVGFRILHLHTSQMQEINSSLLALFEEELYRLREGPIARTWDDESRSYFSGIGIKTKKSPSMYTSVHYIFEKPSKTKFTFEIQVRTLAEELWGEVDHAINYPHSVDSISCKEQIKVLARVTSSCTALVDSIFTTLHETRSAPGSSRRNTT